MPKTIRTPVPIDLSAQRVAVGDTTEFVQKINTTQTEFERYSNDLGDTTSDMMLLATDLKQKAGQVAADRQTVEADKAIVAAAKDTIAADKATTAADVQTVAADKTIVAADKQAVTEHKQAAELAVQQAEQEKNLTIAEKNLAIQARQGAEAAQVLSVTSAESAEVYAAAAAQSALEAGPTHLSVTRNSSSVTVLCSGGDDAVIPVASTTNAGLMSAADKQTLSSALQGGQVNLSTSLTENSVTLLCSAGSNASIPTATTEQAGVMSIADKKALEGLLSGPKLMFDHGMFGGN